ncbi:MAG: hypothetical protein LUD50_02775 [Clostridia bacterium]|nr:hypothetical protein [Clostridia bacterium]
MLELLADTGLYEGLFRDTSYVMPEGWWAIVGVCGGIVLPLMVFAIVFLAVVMPRWRRMAKAGTEAAGSRVVGVGEENAPAAESGLCLVEDAAEESMDAAVEREGASGEYEKKQGDCAIMAEDETVETEDTEDRLDRSFIARLILADDDVKGWYSMLKNAALSYKGTKASMAWKQEKLRCGRKQIGKLLIRGKVLCLYLNLTMDDLKDCDVKYRVEDVSGKAINASTPIMYRIKNPLRARHAVDLIDMVAKKLDLVKAKRFQPRDYTLELVSQTEEQLMDCGLIRTAPQTNYETFTPAKN